MRYGAEMRPTLRLPPPTRCILFVLLLFPFARTGHAASLVQTQEIVLKIPVENPTIIYGNSGIGFFNATHLVEEKKGVWSIQYIPPTYKAPISFYLLKGDQRIHLLTTKASPPPRHPPPLKIQARGRLSTPFFMVNLITEETSPPSFYPAVLNKLGEVVWYDKSHFTPARSLKSSTNLSLHPWQNGLFIRGAGENSRWNLVPWHGKPSHLNLLELEGQRLDAHHSMGASASEIFFWTAVLKKISPLKDSIPLFSGLLGWLRAWGEDGRVIVGNRLVAVNPTTGRLRTIATTFDFASPTRSPSRSLDDNIDRFQDAKTTDDYRMLKTVNDPEHYISERYDTDWSHENAVDVTPEGNLLVTIRNLNSVTLLSPEGKLIWSIGNESFSTHRWSPSQDPLGLPHSARWLEKNRIVVFDNAAPYRGMIKLPTQSRVLWLRLLEGGKIEVEKEILLPGDKSLTKGSIRPIPGKGFLVWHPGPNTGVAQCLETDANGNILGYMTINWPWYKKHDEAWPLLHLGDPAVAGPLSQNKTIYLEPKYDEEVY